METPAARVAFDGIAVQPEYHGPGTLLCHTPPHAPGVVAVNTSNDGKRWSANTAPFRFGEEEGGERPASGSMVPSGHQGAGSDVMMTALFEGDAAALEMAISGKITGLGTRLDKLGYNVMHYAAACCSHSPQVLLPVLNVLMAAGCSFSVRDKKGNTPLHWLLLFGSNASVRMVLQRCPAAVCALPNMEGVSLFHIAAALDNQEALGLLLAKGISPAVRTTEGLTPLHYAAATASPSALALLLRLGGGLVRIGDNEGESPLHYAVRENSPAVVAQLLAAGAPVNLQSSAGETPLLLSCSVANSAAAAALMENATAGSIRFDLKDSTGATALIAAISAGATDIAERILCYNSDSASGATSGAPTEAKGSPYSGAADVNAADCLGRTPLSLAAGQEATGLLVRLRECGAVDGKGKTTAMGSGFASATPSSLASSFASAAHVFSFSPMSQPSAVCV